MNLFDRRSGSGASEWEWVDLGKIEAAEFGEKMWKAVERIASARGRKVGTIMPLNDPGGFLGKTDEEVRDIAQSTVLRASNQLPNEDQRAIAHGDVCIVVAHQWARSKQGNEAWIRLVGVVTFH